LIKIKNGRLRKWINGKRSQIENGIS